MARPVSTGNIPGWFDVSKYSYLKDFGASGWAKVLQVLIPFTVYPANRVVEDYGSPGMSIRDVADDFFADFLTQSPDSEDWEAKWGKTYLRKYPIIPERFRFRSVTSLSCGVVTRMAAMAGRLEGGKRDIKMHEALLRARDSERARVSPSIAAYLSSDEREKFADEPFFLAVRELVNKGGSAWSLTSNRAISVDMNLPDEMILEDFKEWLGSVRKLNFHSAAPKKFKSDDFSKWVDGGYVPLLILDRWAQWTGVHVTFPEMAAAVFPRRTLITHDNVRRTHLPQAKSWLCEENLTALEAQAAKEAG